MKYIKEKSLIWIWKHKPIGECTPTKMQEVCGHKYGEKWVCPKIHATK